MNIVYNYSDIPYLIKKALKGANLFYSKEVYLYNKKQNKEMIYFFDDNKILLAVISRKLFFRYASFLSEPYTYKIENTIESEKDFLSEVISIFKNDYKVDWIVQTPPHAMFFEVPPEAIFIPFGNYVIDLQKSEELLWSVIHSKHKNVIRNAEKKGVTISKGGAELLEIYMLLDNETASRSSLPKSDINKYYSEFEEFSKHINVFLANDCSGAVQGGAIIIYNKAIGYYMHGASINHPITGAMNLLQWNVIKYLKSVGVKKYSFVGCRINEDVDSKYHGIQNFKKRFGGELIVGKMFKVIFNQHKYNLYKQLVKIKTGISSIDIIDQEIHKWR